MRRAALPLAAAVVAAGSWQAGRPPRGLMLTVLDVGQGDAIAVRVAGGGCTLVDAGPAADGRDAGRAIVLPALARLGCRRLDRLVVTHAHVDHLGGLASVARQVPVGEVWDAGHPEGGLPYRQALAAVLGGGIPLLVPVAGTARRDGAATWRVLGPARPLHRGTRSDANNNSVVLLLEYEGTRILLAGDLEDAGERRLLAEVPPGGLRADLLKVAHHGSRFGSSARFLAAVRPRASLVSVGRGNTFGHPDPGTMSRLAAWGPVYRTDRDGALTVTVARATWSVVPWPAAARLASPIRGRPDTSGGAGVSAGRHGGRPHSTRTRPKTA
ncbi:MAG: MBL fold metallo-hydrolase [Candidatus Sericytochromatia bacterium]|nr:MBL fold metallo-hydrolase [Candidatus Tanganyikabacteria bacterium]